LETLAPTKPFPIGSESQGVGRFRATGLRPLGCLMGNIEKHHIVGRKMSRNMPKKCRKHLEFSNKMQSAIQIRIKAEKTRAS